MKVWMFVFKNRHGCLTKRSGASWHCLLVPLVALVFLWSIGLSSSPTATLGHPIPTDTSWDWFRSADYSGILTRVSSESDPELLHADLALDNVIRVWPGLEPYQYEQEIDWRVGGKSNTWYLYFQSLRVVGYLANAAEATGDARYLEKAAEIIESWFDFHRHTALQPPLAWNAVRFLRYLANTGAVGGYGLYLEKVAAAVEGWFDAYRGFRMPPPLAWNEAAVGFRVRNIMHFLSAYKTLPNLHLPDSFFLKIHSILNGHAYLLLQERNYHPNNHGLMASMALTQLALTFPELDSEGLWRETGKYRIRERIEDDLSTENVHLEHSAAYHRFFLDLVLSVEGYLETKGVGLFEPGDATVEGMKEYLAYMVKPDRRLPMMGDTSDSVLTSHYDHSWIAYSLSGGEEGVRPPASTVVYPDAGVAIFREEWKPCSDFLDATYLFFQSAFHSTTHKHADDLGFVLYSRGEDIFAGPGVYAYDSSKYRQYVRSAQAHNTLTVDGRSYAISGANVGKAGIAAYRLEDAFDFVQGSHTMYDGVTLKRGIVFIRPSTILVIDEAVSESEHSIQQIWNLAPAAHDLRLDSQGASFLVGADGVAVEIRQLGSTESVSHYYGQEDPVRGFISPRQRELVPVHQLEFETRGKGIVFVTQISVTGPGEEAPTIEVDLDNPYRDIVVDHGDGITLTIRLGSVFQP